MALSDVITGHTITPYLAVLIARADELAGRLADRDGDAPAAVTRRRDALLATVRLDGSPITAWPERDLLTAAAPGADLPETAADAPAEDTVAARGTWFDAMRTFDVPDDALMARELLGAQAGAEADDLATALGDAPADALAELHRRLTLGLVAPERAGQLRTSEQAVHDASVGRLLYFTVEPDLLPARFAELTSWLAGPAAALPPLLGAGLLHLQVLHLHPFDAANGRLARAAARLWLRRHGLDPAGLAAPELTLERDPLGYHEEVARTLRRRDATIWLERWSEAVVDGLGGSMHALAPPAGEAAATLPAGLPADFTLAELRDQAGAPDLEAARAAAEALLDAGLVVRVPGSRGLRFRRHASA